MAPTESGIQLRSIFSKRTISAMPTLEAILRASGRVIDGRGRSADKRSSTGIAIAHHPASA